MVVTALALLCAHVLADFLFQTDWIIQNKRKPRAMALHIIIVAVLSLLALGIAAAHLMTDAIKTYVLHNKLSSFAADQFAHLITICAAAYLMPDAFQEGFGPPMLLFTCPRLF